MVVTVAPTMPVDAASSVPTTTTEIASPPGSRPSTSPIVSSKSSASRERSSVAPMKTNRVTAMSVKLVMMPQTRSGSRLKKSIPKAVQTEDESGAADGEGDRVARQDQQAEDQKHQGGKQIGHHAGNSFPSTVNRLRIVAETPCSATSTKPMGMTDFRT